MKKRAMFYVISAILIVFALGFLYNNNSNLGLGTVTAYQTYVKSVDANFVNSKECIDSDRGFDWYYPGYVYYEGDRDNKIYYDTCITRTRLREYYCMEGRVRSWIASCPIDYTCINSVCQPDSKEWYRWYYPYEIKKGLHVDEYDYAGEGEV